jgi:hypothetical protein
MNKKEVIKKIEKNKEEIKKLGIKEIGLFGSVLKGKQTNKSDIDMIVEFKVSSFDNYANAIIFLEKILKKKVDLITKSSLRPELNHIKKEAEYARI